MSDEMSELERYFRDINRTEERNHFKRRQQKTIICAWCKEPTSEDEITVCSGKALCLKCTERYHTLHETK